MRFQWGLLVGLLFAIVIAVFAIVNVEAVKVNYLFGTAQIPLILVILIMALLGAAISGIVGMFRSVHMTRQINELKKEMTAKEIMIASQQNEIAALQHGEDFRARIRDNDE
ncbi:MULTISPECIES: lipopolysaccharide assembly protein LapA domain-containing protein [Sporosarcina]